MAVHFILLLLGHSSLSSYFEEKLPRVLNSSKSLIPVGFFFLLLMNVLGSFIVAESISVILKFV